jgi:hypothetical protein
MPGIPDRRDKKSYQNIQNTRYPLSQRSTVGFGLREVETEKVSEGERLPSVCLCGFSILLITSEQKRAE